MYASQYDDTITYQQAHSRVRRHEHQELMDNEPSVTDVIDFYWKWSVLTNDTEVSSDAG